MYIYIYIIYIYIYVYISASELVSSLQFAKKKKMKSISLTYCQVYGAGYIYTLYVLCIYIVFI